MEHAIISSGYSSADARTPRVYQGRPYAIRAVTADDAALIADFLQRVSGRARQQRFLSLWPLSGPALRREVERTITYDARRDAVLVALAPASERTEIIAVAELRVDDGGRDGELAVMVRDDETRRGLGSALVRQLIGIGQSRGIERLHATMLAENWAMRWLLASLEQPYHSETSYGATCVVIDLCSGAEGRLAS